MHVGEIRFARLEDLEQINCLWGANRKTLGMYPLDAFRDAIVKKNVLVVVDDSGQLVGYLLFRISKHRICITHLCTRGTKNGVARRLNRRIVEYSKELDLDGIDLHCRRDYGLQSFWAKLGYIPRGEKPGRGKQPSTLVHWAIRHCREDLLSTALDDRIVAVLDTNVLIRIDADPEQAINHSAKALVADWLQPLVRFAIADEVYLEIDRQDDAAVRDRTRSRAQSLDTINVSPEAIRIARTELLTLFGRKVSISENDNSDLNHLAVAIASGAHYFITHDDAIRQKGEHLDWNWALRVTDPTTLILTLDEVIRETEYSPASLAGTNFGTRRVGASDLDEMVRVFRSGMTNEKAASFSAILRSTVSDTQGSTVECVEDGEQNPVLLLSKSKVEDGLRCNIFRSIPNRLEGTITRHMLSSLVSEAIRNRCREVLISDFALSQEAANASREFGFQEMSGRGLWKPAFYGRHFAHELLNRFATACKEREIEISNTRYSTWLDDDSAATCAELESVFWPAKIDTERIATYVVPIRPYYAMELFDRELAISDDLFGSQAPLALACENVYYRTNHNVGLRAPGRILWYVSKGVKGTSSNTMTIRACSMLNEVVVDTAKNLFQRFKRFGIYSWRDIAKLARNPAKDSIMALRFSHTELFSNPIELESLRAIGIRSSFQSPVRITPEQFGKIYDLGTNREF